MAHNLGAVTFVTIQSSSGEKHASIVSTLPPVYRDAKLEARADTPQQFHPRSSACRAAVAGGAPPTPDGRLRALRLLRAGRFAAPSEHRDTRQV
jgi:hypothetical protein